MNHKPGNSYGFWSRDTIRLRTCSQKCAEIFIQKFEEGALLGPGPTNKQSRRKSFPKQ